MKTARKLPAGRRLSLRGLALRGLALRGAAVGLALLGVAACSGGSVSIDTVEMTVAERANRDTPIAIDLVLVATEELVPEVLAFSAAQWFAAREQFQLDHPGDIQVFTWELVPGQVVPRTALTGKRDSLYAGVVFANYLVPGQHRVRVDQKDVTIRLGEEGVTVVDP